MTAMKALQNIALSMLGLVAVREGSTVACADEFMLVCDIFDPALRLRSLDIAAAALTEPAA